MIRLPLRWERLQPVLGGPLDPGNVALLKGDLAWAAAHGANVIIDIHNYGRYSINENGALNSYVLDNVYGGVTKVSGANLADFWTKMSSEFKGLPAVYAYDLMNEPHDMGTANWQAISQAVVSAIRANGDGTLIMVESDNWSGAYSWPMINGAASWISDPMSSFIYEAHQYFDSDNSGTYAESYDVELSNNPDLATVGVTRLKPFLEWCTNNNVRGYLGEYGIPNTDARWMTVLDNFLTSLDSPASTVRIGRPGSGGKRQPLITRFRSSLSTISRLTGCSLRCSPGICLRNRSRRFRPAVSAELFLRRTLWP